MALIASSLLGLVACGTNQRGGAGSASDGDDIVVDLATLNQSPRTLCTSGTVPDGTEPRVQASIELRDKWVIVTRLEHSECESGRILRRYLPVDQVPDSPVELGCGRMILRTTRAPGVANRALPQRVTAEAVSNQHVLGAKPITLIDFHEDWEGGSGGTLVEGQVEGGILRLTETDVSPGGDCKEVHRTTITEIDLRGLTREVIETKAASVVVSAVPGALDVGARSL